MTSSNFLLLLCGHCLIFLSSLQMTSCGCNSGIYCKRWQIINSPRFRLKITDLFVCTHWLIWWTLTHLFLVLAHGTNGSRQRLPCGAAVVGNHAMNAVVLGHLTRDVDASHRLHPVEVCHLPIVRVQVFLEGLRVHESPHAWRVECAVTSVYNKPIKVQLTKRDLKYTSPCIHV